MWRSLHYLEVYISVSTYETWAHSNVHSKVLWSLGRALLNCTPLQYFSFWSARHDRRCYDAVNSIRLKLMQSMKIPERALYLIRGIVSVSINIYMHVRHQRLTCLNLCHPIDDYEASCHNIGSYIGPIYTYRILWSLGFIIVWQLTTDDCQMQWGGIIVANERGVYKMRRIK